MARSNRSRRQIAAGTLPPPLARFFAALCIEPRPGVLGTIVVLLAVALYAGGLGYPLVYADFALLAPAELTRYAQAHPAWGSRWLADASFGWSARVFGSAWPWHRAINIALHACHVWVLFLLMRRLCTALLRPGPDRLAPGYIAFLAAALFALQPVAVYAVGYLSQRAALLMGLCATLALWCTVRGAQDGWRGFWVAGPAASAAALACGPTALGIPCAMALTAIVLDRAGPIARRCVWIGIGLCVVVALVYGLGYVRAQSLGPGLQGGGIDWVGAACARLLAYLGLWLLPVPAWMAIEMQEPLASVLAPAGSIALVIALVLLLVAALTRAGSSRLAAWAAACTLALYLPELVWPALSRPFAPAQSYGWMATSTLVVAALVGRLPAKAAFVAGVSLVGLWAVLAGVTLATFSSHVALWDDAVRRAERSAPTLDHARIYLNRAAVHRRDGHLLAAIADYDKALALDADNLRALRGRAQAHIDDQRYDAALQDLDRLLMLEPAQAITHADRGLVLMQAGRLAEAGNAFDRAIEQGAQQPRVYLNRGLARLQMSGLEAASLVLADIERALELDPNYALAYFNRGLVFEEAANSGIRLRDAVSPEIMRAVAEENMRRACRLGHAPACARAEGDATRQPPPAGPEGPLRVTPESLRNQGLPPVR